MTHMNPGRNRWKSHYERDKYSRGRTAAAPADAVRPPGAGVAIQYKYFLALIPQGAPTDQRDHAVLTEACKGRAVMLTNTGISFFFKPKGKPQAQFILALLKGKLSRPHQLFYFYDWQYLCGITPRNNTRLYPDGTGVNIPDHQRLNPQMI